jgi:hypothetical protein
MRRLVVFRATSASRASWGRPLAKDKTTAHQLCVFVIHVAYLQNAKMANGKANRFMMFDSMMIRYRGLVESAKATEVGRASFSSKPSRQYTCVPSPKGHTCFEFLRQFDEAEKLAHPKFHQSATHLDDMNSP